MTSLECIIHYECQSSYCKVKPLSDVNIRRINEAKEKRVEIGGRYLHEDQIRQIPETIDQEIHCVHSDPCYKRYVYLHFLVI